MDTLASKVLAGPISLFRFAARVGESNRVAVLTAEGLHVYDYKAGKIQFTVSPLKFAFETDLVDV